MKNVDELPRQSVNVASFIAATFMGAWAWRADDTWSELHATSLRCIQDSRVLTFMHVLRGLAVLTSLLLVFVVRPRVGRWVERHRLSIGSFLRYFIAIVLALVVSEIYLRHPFAPAAPPLPPCPYCPPAVTHDGYGWGLKPSTTFTWNNGVTDIHYLTDDEGDRVGAEDTVRDHERPTILLAGESVALGMGVEYDDSYAGILEKETHLQVVNTAVHGYGVDQAYMRLAEILPRYSHAVAIITLFLVEEGDDRLKLDDRDHLRVDRNGSLELALRPPSWIDAIRLRRLWRETHHGDEELDTMRAIARATATLARERSAYPLFVTTNYDRPCLDVDGRSPEIFRTLFEDQGIPHVHVDRPPDDHAIANLHPSPSSHRKIADAILKALRDARVVP